VGKDKKAYDRLLESLLLTDSSIFESCYRVGPVAPTPWGTGGTCP